MKLVYSLLFCLLAAIPNGVGAQSVEEGLTNSAATAPGVIGWNYCRSTKLNVTDVAGAPGFEQKHWNNHASSGQSPGSAPFPLIDSLGNATAAKVSKWLQSSNNSWQHGQTDGPNQILMNDFCNREPTIVFSEIPYPSYSVIVYYGNNEGPSTSTLSVGRQSRTVTTGNSELSSFGSKGYIKATDENSTIPTNFSVFEGVIGTSLTVSLSGANNNGICALQIVEGEPVAESTTSATPVFPEDATTDIKPWQPLCWNAGGYGEISYDVYLWETGKLKPANPTATGEVTEFTPPSYLSPGTAYQWQVVTQLQSGLTLTSKEFSFRTGSFDGQLPFDLSRDAQKIREADVESKKGLNLLLANTGNGYPIPDGTTLAFFGDSISDVFSYFDGIQSALLTAKKGDASFPNVSVLNRGINGATTDDLLNLPDGDQFSGGSGPNPPVPFRQQIDGDLASLAPGDRYVAVLQIGINDVFQGDNTPKAVYKNRLEQMTDYVLDKGQLVVLVSPTGIFENPLADIVDDGQFDDIGNALLNGYVEALEEIATARGIPFVNQREAYLMIYRNENFTIARDAAGTVTYPRKTGILNTDAVHPNSRGKVLSSELTALGIYQALRNPAPRKP